MGHTCPVCRDTLAFFVGTGTDAGTATYIPAESPALGWFDGSEDFCRCERTAEEVAALEAGVCK